MPNHPTSYGSRQGRDNFPSLLLVLCTGISHIDGYSLLDIQQSIHAFHTHTVIFGGILMEAMGGDA